MGPDPLACRRSSARASLPAVTEPQGNTPPLPEHGKAFEQLDVLSARLLELRRHL